MKRMVIGILLFLPVLLYAQYNRPGSTDAQFLKIGVSARGTGMADAYLASVEGAEATYYNPAAMPWIRNRDVVFTHTTWFAGINHEFAAATQNFDDIGSFGLSVTALYTDEMKVRTPLQPEGTGETFYVGNYRFGLSYSRFLTDRVTFGLTFSYLNMKLYREFTADAFSLDIAVMYVSDFRGFRFALAIADFGSNIQYVNESYPLPTNFQFGMAMNAIDGDDQKLLVSMAAVKPNEGEPQAQLGAEWNYQKMFFVRGGYRLNYSIATWSAGAGAAFTVEGLGLRADYSYSDYKTLGGSHRIGIGVSF
ncbi:MAG: hypothetical protein H6Q31_1264 [Bacteroidetes bacterium]|jgi:hypothetical protein|nr:hypothetical protein [Bacteroidota bacterium]